MSTAALALALAVALAGWLICAARLRACRRSRDVYRARAEERTWTARDRQARVAAAALTPDDVTGLSALPPAEAAEARRLIAAWSAPDVPITPDPHAPTEE